MLANSHHGGGMRANSAHKERLSSSNFIVVPMNMIFDEEAV